MKRIYLCGNTGSANRGCEAIVRATVEILKKCGAQDITAYTFNISDDKRLGLDEDVKLISYPQKSFFAKALGYIENIIFKNKIYGNYPFYESLIRENAPDILTMNVGGDTYCYGTPSISYTLNNIASKKGFPNIFWGCSVDESALKNYKMQKDLNLYSRIVVRETLTQEILEQVVEDKTKIRLACDPAFNLTAKETDLPDNFIINNTVGINLSPLVFSDYSNSDDIVYKNIYNLIDYILEETDMNICLIPHVYNIKENTQDYFVLSNIYNKYRDTQRIGIVNEELSCTELKYIISKCRFFIGARTHATIAAYSTEVPALALSYSIKSLGIAKDLFGEYDEYVIGWQDIKEESTLKNTFIKNIMNNEKEIKKRYSEILPEYKESIIRVTKEVLNEVGT